MQCIRPESRPVDISVPGRFHGMLSGVGGRSSRGYSQHYPAVTAKPPLQTAAAPISVPSPASSIRCGANWNVRRIRPRQSTCSFFCRAERLLAQPGGQTTFAPNLGQHQEAVA